jgi:hypothetical protein
MYAVTLSGLPYRFPRQAARNDRLDILVRLSKHKVLFDRHIGVSNGFLTLRLCSSYALLVNYEWLEKMNKSFIFVTIYNCILRRFCYVDQTVS